MDLTNIIGIIETQGMRLFEGLLVLVVGLFAVHWLIRLLRHRHRFDRIEPTLRGFLSNLFRLLLYVIVILTAASVMGIPMTSFLTLLASAGVAISLAMQGALSNFVGGMTILLVKPFKAGEYISIGDIEGTVVRIGVFYTEMRMLDNRYVSLPNHSLTDTAIVNHTREGSRRLEVVFSVSYHTDARAVTDALLAAVRARADVLPEPAPSVFLSACGESGLSYTVRAWCRPGDYWDAYYGLMGDGKRALDAARIEIPYPQMDVHIR